jgi:hypothetical protein
MINKIVALKDKTDFLVSIIIPVGIREIGSAFAINKKQARATLI